MTSTVRDLLAGSGITFERRDELVVASTGRVVELDAAAATELVPDFPVKIAGKVSGKIGGEIPPAKAGESRVGNLNVDITAPKLAVQGIPDTLAALKADAESRT